MPIMVENEDNIIDVIYDRVCGYKLSEAIQILEKYRTKQLIPVEWIKKWEQKEENYYLFKDLTRKLIEDWEKENEIDRP